MKYYILYFILFCCLIYLPVTAQNTSPQYVKSGKFYSPPPRISNSSPYFKNTAFTRGTIVYDKVKYENQMLAYDVSSDKLVLEDVNYIEVVKKLVDYFTINGDTLFYKGDHAGGIPAGYYERIYGSDKIPAVAKHSKYLKEVMRGTLMERNYQETIRYYVAVPGSENYRDIRSEKDLLNINRDFKKEAKALLRSRSLKFKTRPKDTIQTVLQFYEVHI